VIALNEQSVDGMSQLSLAAEALGSIDTHHTQTLARMFHATHTLWPTLLQELVCTQYDAGDDSHLRRTHHEPLAGS
jgi:hypothetical protein